MTFSGAFSMACTAFFTCARDFETVYKIPVWVASAGCIPNTLLNALLNFPPHCNSLLAFSTVNCWN